MKEFTQANQRGPMGGFGGTGGPRAGGFWQGEDRGYGKGATSVGAEPTLPPTTFKAF